MPETKLLPCPFCGGEPTIRMFKGKDGWRDRYAVLCRYDEGGCGAESGLYHYKRRTSDRCGTYRSCGRHHSAYRDQKISAAVPEAEAHWFRNDAYLRKEKTGRCQMIQFLFTILYSDVGDDIREKWHKNLLEDSLQDLRVFAVIITLTLCILALAVVMLVVAKILEKKNDYGDEDEMQMRNDKSSYNSINAKVYSELASGSINCMKNFRYEDVSRR